MSGAADRVLAIATQYATERVQFGRSIRAFQAIQHMLAELSTYAAVIGATAAVLEGFETADGPIIIAAGNDALFHKLCSVIGKPEWASDPGAGEQSPAGRASR